MKIGDHVKMSEKNLNHLGTGVCAYAGMEGIVSKVYEDNAFVLECKTSVLIVPMRNAFKHQIDGVWIELNGNLIFHKPISEPKSKNWFLNLFNVRSWI